MSRSHTMDSWDAHYGAGYDFRPLEDTEKAVLHKHLALPEGQRERGGAGAGGGLWDR